MYDVNLELDSGSTISSDGNTAPIQVEGDTVAWWVTKMGTMTGAATTLDSRLQYSPDLGVNYYMCPGGKMQQWGPTDDNSYDRCPVYIPPPTTAGNPVYVRINDDVAGASPSYARTKSYLEPMLSPTVPATDKTNTEGALTKRAAV